MKTRLYYPITLLIFFLSLGSCPVAFGQTGPEIGDEKQFRLAPNGSFHTFVLRDKSSLHYLWVERSELGSIPDARVAALHTALVENTPEGSVNPGKGIIENLHDLFGQPENRDSDGLVDILLFDIPGTGYGYVDGRFEDYDVLYIDSRELVQHEDSNMLLSIVAHEYVHLIHINFMNLDNFPNHVEKQAIAEGIAEYGRIALGYAEQVFNYGGGASNMRSALYLGRALFALGGRTVYFRLGLFHLYIAEQLGHQAVRDVLQNARNAQGEANYRSILANYGTTLSDIITGFHLANYLNDHTPDPHHGYAHPAFQHFRVADTPSAFTLHVDGTTTTETPEMQATIMPGAVQYFVWDDVEDFEYTINSSDNLVRSLLILEWPDGSIAVHGTGLGGQTNGHFARVMLMAVHIDPGSSSASMQFAASWKGTAVAVEGSEIPHGVHLAQNYPNPFNPSTTLRYSIDRPAPVSLAIYNILGQRVRTLVEAQHSAGEHTTIWDGRNDAGEAMASGMYLARMQVNQAVQTRTMLLVK